MDKKKQLEQKEELNPYSLYGIDGIGPTTIQQLEENGIRTMYDVKALSPTTIAQFIKGDSDKATKLYNFCKDFLIDKGLIWDTVMTASELAEKQKNLNTLTTGCNDLDYLLDGGVKSRSLTEFYGETAAGKSQLGSTLAIMAQRPVAEHGLKLGENPPIIIIIDTENKYSPQRLKQIVISRGFAKDEQEAGTFLNNIKLIFPKTVTEQLFAIGRVREWLSNQLDIKLIIIDSMSALVRAEMSERNVSWLKKDVLNKMFLEIRGIAETFNVVVVLMNQIYNSPDMNFGDPDIAFGGNIWGHALGSRIKLERTQAHIKVGSGQNERKYVKCKARIIKSPTHGEEEIQYYVNETGLVGVT